ncbi:MAG: acylase [Bacteroidota bacterium]
MRHWFLLLLLPFLFSCRTETPNSAATDLARWETHATNTTIIRDDFGVPHIYGKTDADAVFGLLYAQCEDDFPRVEDNYVWASGRLAEVEGEDALYSDLRAQLFMTKEEAIAAYESSPAWLRELCQAFADGINYYLHTHPEVKPALLTRFEPWMPMYFSEGSIGGDIERVSTRRIRAFYESNAQLSLNEPKPSFNHRAPDEEPRGSNGIAIAGELTESGNAMLLINPHTSFYFRGEVHMVSEEGLNAYGAVTWGQFFIYQGFNEKTGWMHTSTYTDVLDEFVETIEEQDGRLMYKYGEEWRPVESQEVSLRYKAGDQVLERQFTIHRTHHGPITHQRDDQWVATAMMWEPVKALTQSYTRTKQSTHAEFRKMMDIRTNSSNNTVYADADGNIAYYHGNFIPIRDSRFDYTQPVDGSDPATDWQGLHPVDEAITILNPPNGWLQNCNSTPFTATGANSPKVEDYPKYMSRNQENHRGVHALQLLEGRDGYTLDNLLELAYDPYLPAFADLLPGLVAAYDAAPNKPTGLAAPMNTLRNWDFRTSATSVAMSLAHYYGLSCARNGTRPAGLNYMERIKYFGTDSPNEEKLRLFSAAVDTLTAHFGSWNTPWGEINRLQRLSGAIEADFDDNQPSVAIGLASGRWGALASYGARRQEGTKRLYGTSGNSFVAVVEFGDKVVAKSMLAGGQSNDPNSSHFFDQGQRYADAKFKDVAYYREDVEKRAEETYHPGKR